MKGATGRGPAYRRRLAGKTVSVVGLARSGVAAARLIRRVGGHVLASDAAEPRARSPPRRAALERDGLRAVDGRPPRRGLRGRRAGGGEPGRAAHARPPSCACARRGVPIIGELELGVAGDGGRRHRHHGDQRQDDHDRAHRRAPARARCGPSSSAATSARRLSEHALDFPADGIVVAESSSFQLESTGAVPARAWRRC